MGVESGIDPHSYLSESKLGIGILYGRKLGARFSDFYNGSVSLSLIL
jgi:hypothetical protein